MLFKVIIHDQEKPVYVTAESEKEIVNFIPTISKDKYTVEKVSLVRAADLGTIIDLTGSNAVG